MNSWPTLPDQAEMSVLVPGSVDQISMTEPTGTPDMPFLASRQRARAGGATGVDDFSASMASSSATVAVMCVLLVHEWLVRSDPFTGS